MLSARDVNHLFIRTLPSTNLPYKRTRYTWKQNLNQKLNIIEISKISTKLNCRSNQSNFKTKRKKKFESTKLFETSIEIELHSNKNESKKETVERKIFNLI